MQTLYIGGGRKQKVRPCDILGGLTGAAGLKGDDVGKIEIQDNFSYVAVNKTLASGAADRLKAAGLKGRRFQVALVQ